jgi:hypothetical protein
VLLARIVGLLAAIALGGLVLTYVLTGERKYLRYAWHLLRGALFLVLLALLLIFGERLVNDF